MIDAPKSMPDIGPNRHHFLIEQHQSYSIGLLLNIDGYLHECRTSLGLKHIKGPSLEFLYGQYWYAASKQLLELTL